MPISNLIGLDFETYGSVNLPKHGLARYVEDKLFMPLIGSVAWGNGRNHWAHKTWDFVSDKRASRRELLDALTVRFICAHNAPFEAAVLDHLNIQMPSSRFRDSAVVARAVGGGSSLAAAAPQLLDVDKMEEGRNLIKLFSIPGKYQVDNEHDRFDPQVIEDHPHEWALFREYCELDAELSLRLVQSYGHLLTDEEWEYNTITMRMNKKGWPVDIPTVEEMQRRYLENLQVEEQRFRSQNRDATELNLNSLKQLKEWCGERGIRASSFSEEKVATLRTAVLNKLDTMSLGDPRYNDYTEVAALLKTKQILGGSSLKKLAVILDTAVPVPGGHRLKDQYLHAGAGQTWRTTGRSVQMQNLKRLATPANMVSLFDPSDDWTNDELAENIRQTFTASHPQGRLIVGDFSSVESRGLAYLAGEEWKLDAYRNGLPVYEVQAGKIFDIPYTSVTKDQRQLGKVGELSCGYGAGGQAVKDFAAKMGTELELAEASKLVYDWRDANPHTVIFWSKLDDMLRNVVSGVNGGMGESLRLPDALRLRVYRMDTPASLLRQHPGAQSVAMSITLGTRQVMLRIFHGCHLRGRNVGYYKPSDRKTGDLWTNHFTDPKTKQVRFYELYGGKLAGILTQSFCRELFMQSLKATADWCQTANGVELIGQFHDEIVLDWVPGATMLHEARQMLATSMSSPGFAASFPLAADIKDDYRYTK